MIHILPPNTFDTRRGPISHVIAIFGPTLAIFRFARPNYGPKFRSYSLKRVAKRECKLRFCCRKETHFVHGKLVQWHLLVEVCPVTQAVYSLAPIYEKQLRLLRGQSAVPATYIWFGKSKKEPIWICPYIPYGFLCVCVCVCVCACYFTQPRRN